MPKTATPPADGPEVRRRRRLQGDLQYELAAKADISPEYLSRIETGHAPNPSPRVFRQLAEALSCSIADILRANGAGDDDR